MPESCDAELKHHRQKARGEYAADSETRIDRRHRKNRVHRLTRLHRRRSFYVQRRCILVRGIEGSSRNREHGF